MTSLSFSTSCTRNGAIEAATNASPKMAITIYPKKRATVVNDSAIVTKILSAMQRRFAPLVSYRIVAITNFANYVCIVVLVVVARLVFSCVSSSILLLMFCFGLPALLTFANYSFRAS